MFWLVFSAFGLAYFQIMAFVSIEYFLICLASWSGVFFCICAIHAANSYPKVTKFVAISALLGSATLFATLLVLHFSFEMPTVHILSIPAILLFSGVALLI
ncbi:hypothetical protein, partial [Aestuariibacter sp. GS-14]|uniref:hypothetical protein n=1 Tax=Aestuariibacter sp. GS-14 TaxID=2590670 RepID=UPI001C6429CD